MQTVLQVLTILGGLAMFLYSMTLMSESLQKAAGEKLQTMLSSMTSTPFKGILTGFLVTAIIQSSGATTVMVVSFVNAGILSLTNAIGVIMGANIGTTVTTWIVTLFGFSYSISQFAVPLVLVGFIFMLTKRYKNVGQIIIGFALLFLALSIMQSSVPDLRSNPEALAFLQKLNGFGFGTILLFLLIGTVLTVILQSSSVTTIITLMLVQMNWISFEAAAAMVLGENIGATVTANIAATIGNVQAKRTALVHTLFNVIGVIWVLALFKPFLKLMGLIVTGLGMPNPTTADFSEIATNPTLAESMQNSLVYGVAILHTLFNVLNTLLLMWFTPLLEKAVSWIIKSNPDEIVFRLKYIHAGLMSTPELSLNEAGHEVVNFAEICHRQFGYMYQAVNEKDHDKFSQLYQKLVKYEEITDRVEWEIASYLNEVSKGVLSEASVERIKGIYRIISELESLGDSSETIGRILQRKNAHEKEFDDDILEHLNAMLALVDDSFKIMLDNLRKPYGTVTDITPSQIMEDRIGALRNSLREEHTVDIENREYLYDIGVYYMDIVAELERMGDIIINVSQAAAGRGKLYGDRREPRVLATAE